MLQVAGVTMGLLLRLRLLLLFRNCNICPWHRCCI